jgi:HK97 family phage portal protein
MKWLDKLLGHKPERRNVGGWDQWIPSPSLAGVVVTPEVALSLTSVFACVSCISNNIASLPFLVYERLEDGGRRPDYEHVLHDLISVEPNPDTSAFSFWSTLISHAVLYGNGFAEIVRAWDGTPEAFHILDPTLTQVKRDLNTQRVYYESTYQIDSGSPMTSRLLGENVLHIVGSISHNSVVGMSPVVLARECISGFMSAEKHASAAFGQSSTFVGLIKTPDELDDQARKNLRENFNRLHQGPYNAGKVGILDNGMEFQALQTDLAQLQNLETRRWEPNEIARLFGVPPSKIGDLEHSSYNNVEQANRAFYMETLRIWCERIESEVNRKLLTKADRKTHFCEYNMNSFLRGDSATQADVITKLFGIGALSVNGVCQELGFNPIGPQGDQRFISQNLQPLGDPDAEPVDPTVLPENTPSDPEAEPEGDPEALADSIRSVVLNDLQRATYKETQAVKRALKKPDFEYWKKSFYLDHRDHLVHTLAPGLKALSNVLKRHIDPDQVADQIVAHSIRELEADDRERRVSEWDKNKAVWLYKEYVA